MKYLLFFLTFIVGIGPGLHADSRENTPNPQLQLLGARHISLGGTNPTLLGDINGIFINPASMGNLELLQFSGSNQRVLDEFNYTALNVGLPYKDLSLAFSYGGVALDGIPETIFDGKIRSIGEFSQGTNVFQGTVSKTMFDIGGTQSISLGASTKLYHQYVFSDSALGVGFDIGAIANWQLENQWLNRVYIGGSVLNLLSTAMTFDSVDQSNKIGREIYVGGRLDMLDEQLSVFGQNHFDGITVGAEYQLPGNLFLRASTDLNLNRYHLGTGLQFDRVAGFNYQDYGLRIDYAFTQNLAPFDSDPTHTFSVSFLGESRLVRPVILDPKMGYLTKETTAKLSGIADPNSKILIFNNNNLTKTIRSDQYGKWSVLDYPLKEGENKITVRSYSLERDTSYSSKPILIETDNQAPELDVDIMALGDQLKFNLTTSEAVVSIDAAMDNTPIQFSALGDTRWEAILEMPAEIANHATIPQQKKVLSLVVQDEAGNRSKPVERDFFMALDSPADQSVHYQDTMILVGTGSSAVKRLSINDRSIRMDNEHRFSSPQSLKLGKNELNIEVLTQHRSVLNYKLRVLRLQTFDDLAEGMVGKKEIEYLATLKVLSGKRINQFLPQAPLTRLELAEFLVNQSKIKKSPVYRDLFSDVSQSDLFAPTVQAVIQAGLMIAQPDGRFNPNGTLEIGELLQILNNAGFVSDEDVFQNTNTATRRNLALILAYSPRYAPQIETLTTW